MEYNFSKIIDANSLITEGFIESHILNIAINDDIRDVNVVQYYKKILNLLNTPFKEKDLLELFFRASRV